MNCPRCGGEMEKDVISSDGYLEECMDCGYSHERFIRSKKRIVIAEGVFEPLMMIEQTFIFEAA